MEPDPMNDADLRNRLIRLAHTNPAVRKDVLRLLASEGPTMGKYEEGKPADPTENMSPEDKKTWELNTLKHKDDFKKEGANVSRLKRDIRLKSGEVVPQGSKATVEFDPDRASLAILKVEGRDKPVKVSTINLHEYLAGFSMPPSRASLAKWVDDGIAKSVAGQKVETDGWDSKGTPSWLLVLGYI